VGIYYHAGLTAQKHK